MKLTNRYKERFRRRINEVQGRAVGFRVDEIGLPDGKVAQREYLSHPGAVGVLAIDRQGKILLIKQYRYPVATFTYEIPAGKLAKGENPLSCVKRELEEEAGVRARKIKKLVAFWPTPAFSDEIIHLYIAHDLVVTEAHPDEDEFLELVRYSPEKVERLIRQGAIQDSKTLIAFFGWRCASRRAKRSR
jgi:ADP-ribose pyrophosphatase